MTESDSAGVPIGTVTRLTGISTHTLRKWESRYHAIVPIRTPSGRRLYSQDHIERLILLRDLIQQGHQISQLSEMANDALTSLLATTQTIPPEIVCSAGVAVGQVLTTQLAADSRARDLTLIAEPAAEWLHEAAFDDQPENVALAVELPTVQVACIDKLLSLKRTQQFAQIVVVYGFATRKTLRQLLDGGMVCLKAPVGVDEVLKNMAVSDNQNAIMQTLEQQAVPAHRFSSESIARVAVLTPQLQCECPNHIAQLLLDISAFEQFSMECEDTDPGERALHTRLRIIAANARALFEEALATVAANEGVELEEL